MKLEWRPVSIGGGPEISTALTDAETKALMRLAAAQNDVLEIGSAYGYSTVVLAKLAKRVVAVDPHEALSSLSVLRANLALYGVSHRVQLECGLSDDVMPRLHAEGRRFDLIWVDGDHQQHAVAHDVAWAVQLLAPGGVLACHDYDEDTCQGVRAALDIYPGPPVELVDTLAVYRGLA